MHSRKYTSWSFSLKMGSKIFLDRIISFFTFFFGRNFFSEIIGFEFLQTLMHNLYLVIFD